MIGKKYTVLVLPRRAGQVKILTIGKALPVFLLAFFLVLFAGVSSFAYYSWHKLETFQDLDREVKRLREDNRDQTIQVFAFADKIRLLEQEMGKLRQSDLKLRTMSSQGKFVSGPVRPGLGGSDSQAVSPRTALKTDSRRLIRRMHLELEQLLDEADQREQSQQELGRFLEDARSIIASTPDILPLEGEITSFFGYRTSPFGGRSTEFHRGLDIVSGVGTPIVAPADGIVLASEWNSGYGLILTINHGYGVVTRYAHLAKVYVEPGDTVEKGRKICATGMSGRTTGPHLHYETIFNGVPVNPLRFLADRE
ncbi:MAG: M23 family metallopeptidase [Pseudomonadota bacterium]